jgi:hypothetical protein
MRLRSVVPVLAAVAALAAAGASSGSSAAPPRICGTRAKPPATYAHVLWIWFENHSYDKVVGPPGSKAAAKAPYLNRTLIPACGLATNYHSLAHPSLPNYVAATSGSTQGIRSDCVPDKCPLSASSIFEQVPSWRSYHESMPANCTPADAGTYPADHNPVLYFTRLAGKCATNDVPLGTLGAGSFAAALARNTLPAFSLVVPDSCNSTEDCGVATGDAWLARWVGAIVRSRTYRAGRTALFITWDEGKGGGDCTQPADPSCHVAAVVISPTTRPGTKSAVAFDHYSLLKTTEQLLGIRTYLGHAGDAATASMRGAFRL